MTSVRRSRSVQWRNRLIGAVAAGAVFIPLLAACGSDSDDSQTNDARKATETAAASEPNSDSESGAFPVTVSGAYGDITIESQPKRVVALSPTDADILLSLGVTPVAIPTSVQTNATTNNTGLFPWAEGKYPAGTPQLNLSTADASTLESILALEPDLMVGTAFYGLVDQTYTALKDIAPIVAYSTAANGDSWQDSTRKVAKAVGLEAKGEEVIASAEAIVPEAAAANPALKGKTFNVLITPSAASVYILCSADDNLGRVMKELGMVLSDYAQSVPCDGGRTEVSYESLPSLDADVLIVFPDTAEQMSALTDQQLWNNLPAVKRGAVVEIPKTESVPAALAFPSATSLEWAVDQMVPQIAEAAAK
jgi:iron complex transport system substrate-binding protein